MKTNYLLDKKTIFSNRPRRGGGGPWTFLIILIIVFTLGGFFVYQLFSGPATKIVTPMKAGGSALVFSLGNSLPYFRAKESLVRENLELKSKLNIARRQVTGMSIKLDELSTLAQSVGRDYNNHSNITIAKVLAPTGFLTYDLLLIDRGNKTLGKINSIKRGDLALSENNLLLGEVVEVGAFVSKVRLYSSAGRKTAIAIGHENISALAVGRGGGNYLATLPVASNIVHNDLVRVTINNREYILGVVGAIEKSEEAPYQRIYIKPTVNIYELRFIGLGQR